MERLKDFILVKLGLFVDFDNGDTGSLAEWAAVFIAVIAAWITYYGFKFVKEQIGLQQQALNDQKLQLDQQKKQLDLQEKQLNLQKTQFDAQLNVQNEALLQQGIQLSQQKEQFDFQIQQYAQQGSEEYFRQALSLIEVAYNRLSIIMKMPYYKPRTTSEYNGLISSDFERNKSSSFEEYKEALNLDQVYKIRSLLMSLINHTGLILSLSEKVNKDEVNRMIISILYDIINGFGARFVFYTIVTRVLTEKGSTFDLRICQVLLQLIINSGLVSKVKLENTFFFQHPMFRQLDDIFTSIGLDPLTPPSNPS